MKMLNLYLVATFTWTLLTVPSSRAIPGHIAA